MTIHIGRTALTWIVPGALGAGALALLAGVPLSTILWLGLVLACPLMMLIMRGGHQHGGASNPPGETPAAPPYPPGV